MYDSSAGGTATTPTGGKMTLMIVAKTRADAVKASIGQLMAAGGVQKILSAIDGVTVKWSGHGLGTVWAVADVPSFDALYGACSQWASVVDIHAEPVVEDAAAVAVLKTYNVPATGSVPKERY